MRRVSQKSFVEVDDRGVKIEDSPVGDCFSACIASIFEIPLEQAPGMGGNSQEIWDWLALNYAGVGMVVRDWICPRRDVHHSGFWIATVISPRYKEPECFRCRPDLEQSKPPYFWRREECPRCGGTGEPPGLHAVVMEHGKLAWDPHPLADHDTPQIVGETVFTVTDPARLTARSLPRPL